MEDKWLTAGCSCNQYFCYSLGTALHHLPKIAAIDWPSSVILI